MNRRDKKHPPRPDMIWSRKHRMWTDPDIRPPAEKARHAAIAKPSGRDLSRIRRKLKQASKASALQMAMLADNLGRRLMKSLVFARLTAGLKKSDVARLMGVPASAVVRFESGRHSPTLSTLARYALAVRVMLTAKKASSGRV